MKKKKFYGSTTIGERGQVVIPSKAREALHLKNGDQLLTIGIDDSMLLMMKYSQLEEFIAHLTENLDDLQKLVKDSQS